MFPLFWSDAEVEILEGSHARHNSIFTIIPNCTSATETSDFNLLHEVVAIYIEEISESGADRLLKIFSHPNFYSLMLKILWQIKGLCGKVFRINHIRLVTMKYEGALVLTFLSKNLC